MERPRSDMDEINLALRLAVELEMLEKFQSLLGYIDHEVGQSVEAMDGVLGKLKELNQEFHEGTNSKNT